MKWPKVKIKKPKVKKPKVKKPKAKKRVKKNTLYRKLRAWDLRLDHRQQQRMIIPKEEDETLRRCANCSHVYTGRVCPQCGQVGSWDRYTWRQAFMNFLDIWGLGNRPMFRTLRELFWRPGYMARDYLNGHRQFYFPPFKLLALVVLFTIFFGWLIGVENEPIFADIAKANLSALDGFSLTIASACTGFAALLSKSPLYEWLFIGIFVVLCVWFGFRNVSKYNLVETYIFLVFILCQWLLFRLPVTLCQGIYNFVELHSEFKVGSLFTITNYPILGFFDVISNRLSTFYYVAFGALLLVDFRQFYGLNWKSTIKRLSVSGIAMLCLLMVLIIIGVVLISYGDISDVRNILVLFAVWLVLIFSAFTFANWYLKKNKELVPKWVTWVSKISMLSVIYGLGVAFSENLSLLITVLLMILYAALCVVASLLPVVLYKRFHNRWLALLPLIIVVTLVVLADIL